MIVNFFYTIMNEVYNLFQLQITIDEYSFTLWSAFLFGCCCIIAARFIGGLSR